MVKRRISKSMVNDIFDLSTTDVSFYDNIMKNKSKEFYSKLKYISCDEYFKICADFHDTSLETEISMINYENIKHLLDFVKENKFPTPVLNYYNKEQEGRHRVCVAKQLGIESIPVMCFYKKD